MVIYSYRNNVIIFFLNISSMGNNLCDMFHEEAKMSC